MSTRNKNRNLYYLEELSDYKVADSDKDVRGWKVQDIDGKTIGEVDNLLVNKNTERVAYLNVKVDDSIISANHQPYSTKANEGVHDFINKEGENHIIIPIGMATLDLKNHIVSTTNINHQTFAQTKRFKSGSAIQREYEVDVFNSYTRPTTATIYPDDDSFYDRDEFKL
jgi:sporulation protein YlmC with PRC-barrel domain